ncbi:MAG: hypothetical protein KGH57_00145 [Candidatus Micrarchaeota archaeon]|nr:hypothetical protein [Candidatus Micrarchaeota archaeon]
MLPIVLSFGAIYALIPLLIIIILIAAAAGISRGYDIFSIFGIGVLAGIGGAASRGGKATGSIAGKTAYKGRAGSVLVRPMGKSIAGKMLGKGVAGTAGKIKGVGNTIKAKQLANDLKSMQKGGELSTSNLGKAQGVKLAAGAVLAVGALHNVGLRLLGSGAYGRAAKKFEEARQRNDTKKMQEWGYKMNQWRERHGVQPTTALELASTAYALQYMADKVGAQKGPGAELNISLNEKGKPVSNRAKTLSEIQARKRTGGMRTGMKHYTSDLKDFTKTYFSPKYLAGEGLMGRKTDKAKYESMVNLAKMSTLYIEARKGGDVDQLMKDFSAGKGAFESGKIATELNNVLQLHGIKTPLPPTPIASVKGTAGKTFGDEHKTINEFRKRLIYKTGEELGKKKKGP